MGHKDSFSGGGGNIGNDLRDGIDDWLESLPGGAGTGADTSTDSEPGESGEPQPGTSSGTGAGKKPKLSPTARRVLPTAALFKTSSGTGSSSRRGKPAQFTRSAAASSRVAGRGAAAAYAYRTGNSQVLRELGLDYEALRSNPNVIDVVHQIAQRVCEELPPGTIDTEEQIRIVADIAEWIVTTDVDGNPPSPDEIAVQTLAVVLNWAYLTTTAAEVNTKNLTANERIAFEADVRAACEELATQAELSPTGATPSEFTAAIEHGLEFLQAVYGGSDE
ncbi:hypothetical protein AB0N38_19595 [Micromonospora aurantiaca]|uniref:hypothetical protein n=1 Tax=Micromonospora aurantiaca (nom. illeg.) TaxID=47850 RepID=UPI0034243F79